MALAMQTVSSTPISNVSNRSSSSIRNSRPLTANNPSRYANNTKFIVDWNNPSTKNKSNTDNLQDAFQRFRQQRMVCRFFDVLSRSLGHLYLTVLANQLYRTNAVG